MGELEQAHAAAEEARAAAERAQAEAQALLRFSEMMAGILAHDLRNPLAAVLMNARLLRSAERERERTIANRIIASGDRMTRMIDQILDWTRVRSDAGHVRLTCGACDLARVADEVVGEHKARAAETSIDVSARGDLRGHWDGDRLAQMLSNLVGNAVDYAAAPGVRLCLDGTGDDISITVENPGRIEDEALPVMFEPFRGRASGSRVRGRGLGLGLYISRVIVTAHGGRIDASQADDRVIFTVTLPRRATA